ncbi:MAG: hypothetical protein ABIJ56_02300, partial [Pseudomonadota bacterium]
PGTERRTRNKLHLLANAAEGYLSPSYRNYMIIFNTRKVAVASLGISVISGELLAGAMEWE